MKFILTRELGRLAKWLRILGYDTLYYGRNDRAKLIIISLRENRIILTRDSKMARFTGVRMFGIDKDNVEDQLEQVVKGLNLKIREDKTFQRCVDCNEILSDIPKERIKNKVPEYVYKTQSEFKICPLCKKIFWKGTHWELVKKFLQEVNL